MLYKTNVRTLCKKIIIYQIFTISHLDCVCLIHKLYKNNNTVNLTSFQNLKLFYNFVIMILKFLNIFLRLELEQAILAQQRKEYKFYHKRQL